MQARQQHRREVQAFLRQHIATQNWRMALPEGSGHETYFAQGDDRGCFVKLGAEAARYQTMASIGLTPEVLATGSLEDGTSILVQPLVVGRTPSRSYYPPVLRRRFLEIVGHADDDSFQSRMPARMAMHCLSITLPRERSFDTVDPGSFTQSLTDLRAVLAGQENPQGYDYAGEPASATDARQATPMSAEWSSCRRSCR